MNIDTNKNLLINPEYSLNTLQLLLMLCYRYAISSFTGFPNKNSTSQKLTIYIDTLKKKVTPPAKFKLANLYGPKSLLMNYDKMACGYDVILNQTGTRSFRYDLPMMIFIHSVFSF
ncbi:MAG: hypothetical protein WCA84_10785 [Ignavibacteriaceae bacterium]|jgi:hypothetical protein